MLFFCHLVVRSTLSISLVGCTSNNKTKSLIGSIAWLRTENGLMITYSLAHSLPYPKSREKESVTLYSTAGCISGSGTLTQEVK